MERLSSLKQHDTETTLRESTSLSRTAVCRYQADSLGLCSNRTGSELEQMQVQHKAMTVSPFFHHREASSERPGG